MVSKHKQFNIQIPIRYKKYRGLGQSSPLYIASGTNNMVNKDILVLRDVISYRHNYFG